MTRTTIEMTESGTGALLDAVYRQLGYADVEGTSLLEARPTPRGVPGDGWIDKGDWLLSAYKANVTKVFFLENNPVALFLRTEDPDPEVHRRLYNRAWSMARPRLLFFARPGAIAVYDLAEKPPKTGRDFEKLEPLRIAHAAADIATRMKDFRRQALESGKAFETERRFADLKNRADKTLISDLKKVRSSLVESGLGGDKLPYAHSLIGRSIFIRYLEDRDILTERTFNEVAAGNRRWQKLLQAPPTRPGLEVTERPSLYARTLEDKKLTYALFHKLAQDFNGDMFPDLPGEEGVVTQDHLQKIQGLLFGDTGQQQSLFFYAYNFEIVPIDLISSIYEEFYHKESKEHGAHGAYYTPPVLVELVLEQVLTPGRLAETPRILDLSCGSGIFLVESFRRIVRYRTARQGRRLRFDELKKILRDQLRGIDVNAEAIRVAAFSLYLALLHYLESPDVREQIDRGNCLPNLVAADRSDSFSVLLAADAFDPEVADRITRRGFDVVVGNPPWGSPGRRDAEARQLNQIAMDWCRQQSLPVGDQERSQAFIWRALDALAPGGTAGLLVSAGVLFKHHSRSVEFRRQWLDSCTLQAVFNFSHTRRTFFKGSVSPFVAVVFNKLNGQPSHNRIIKYWSAARTRLVDGLQSVVFSHADVKHLRPEDDLTHHQTWKTFWWGTHLDHNLALGLQARHGTLGSLTAPGMYGRGYQFGNREKDTKWLSDYKSLPIRHFHRYGHLDPTKFENVPPRVERRGVREVYHGRRILVRRGIDEGEEPKGQVVARIEEDEFCFTNAIHGIKLSVPGEWRYKVILGIFWSSLARYFFFVTGSSWGIWHHELHLEDEVLAFPVCLPEEGTLRRRIVRIVEKLQSYDPPARSVLNPDGVPQDVILEKRRGLERSLDDAIFELYGLNEAEIDLIRDMCDVTIDFYYWGSESQAVKPVCQKLSGPRYGSMVESAADGIQDYLRIFLNVWSRYLDDGTHLHWTLHASPHGPAMLAVVFSVHEAGDEPFPSEGDEAWDDVLRRLDDALLYPVSSRIFVDGMVRAVTGEEIVVIKRNEKRLWTRSMAREDAEATLVQAMKRDAGGED